MMLSVRSRIERLSAFLVVVWLAAGVCHAATTSIIVELEGDPAAVHKAKLAQQGLTITDEEVEAHRQSLRLAQDAFLARAAAGGIDFAVAATNVYDHQGAVAATIERRYTLVYNGIALVVPVEQVASVAALDGVRKVHRDRVLRLDMDRSVDYVRAPGLYGTVAELGPFDDLREGFEGQGIHVAVIDTGIEWHHEMFGGDPAPPRLGVHPATAAEPTNGKVIYYMPMADLAVEDGFGHGTHVSSTAAGYRGFAYGADGLPLTEDDLPIHGMAPQARLMVYGVCLNVVSVVGSLTGAIGGCLTSNTIFALEDAVSPRTVNGFAKPVAHVINLSLGGSFGTPDDPSSVAASNAALLGAVVVASAGNAGDVAQIVGAPSTGRRVISVAASNDPGVFPHSIDVVDGAGGILPASRRITAVKASDSNGTLPYAGGISEHYVFAGLADTPDQVPASVAGRICLALRGSTISSGSNGTGLFANKAAQCTAKGAIATIVFNNVAGEIGDVLAPSPNPVFTISREDGLYLKDELGFDPAGISLHPVRLNGPEPALFTAGIAGFSSRGPVQGWGQVKPDLSAPGVNVLAAVPPASLMGALAAREHGPSFGSASGTSFSAPHVAGAAALVKQANLGWHPDEVRTALINTATPLRDRFGQPAPHGTANPRIHAQGGGLIDVEAAATARALMGVIGDGVSRPFILGSHSFGRMPILGNQCTSSHEVEVSLVDQRGAGGAYRISAFPNREADRSGVGFLVPPGEVVVPPGGSASFTTGLVVDSTALDPAATLVEFQWFVVAERTDGAETLSMPMYLRAIPSVPGAGIGGLHDAVQTFSGTNLGGTPAVVFLNNHNVSVPLGTLRIQATLEGDELVDEALTEVELRLIYQDGTVVAASRNPGNFEFIDYPMPAPGTYNVQVRGDTGAPVSFDLTVVQSRVAQPAAAVLAEVATEHVEQNGTRVDFDGAFTLSWSASGNESGFVVEQRIDAGAWEPLASLDGDTTTFFLSGLQNGTYEFRIVAQFPGAICTFVMPPSNVRRVVVDLREQVTITGSVSTRIVAASFAGGVFSVDVVLINDSAEAYLNPVELDVVAIHSSTNDIRVINADNGGSGTSAADPARFSYAAQMGDETFSQGETSGPRTLRFADPSGQLFTFEAVVRAYRRALPVQPDGSTRPRGGVLLPGEGGETTRPRTRPSNSLGTDG